MNNCFYWLKEDCASYNPPKYIKLNPTGRWKIVYGPQYRDRNTDINVPIFYIEHQGRFWKFWVAETEIVFLVERGEFINDCNR